MTSRERYNHNAIKRKKTGEEEGDRDGWLQHSEAGSLAGSIRGGSCSRLLATGRARRSLPTRSSPPVALEPAPRLLPSCARPSLPEPTHAELAHMRRRSLVELTVAAPARPRPADLTRPLVVGEVEQINWAVDPARLLRWRANDGGRTRAAMLGKKLVSVIGKVEQIDWQHLL